MKQFSICVGLAVLLLIAVASTVTKPAAAQTTDSASALPPVILQGCAEKVKAKRFNFYGDAFSARASGRGDQTVGFDVSFINTSEKVANLVVIRIGETDFAKTGTFSPGAVIAWRLAAAPGACAIRAVRFADGSLWQQNTSAAPTQEAPSAEKSPSPAH